jgi:hypothetical protein
MDQRRYYILIIIIIIISLIITSKLILITTPSSLLFHVIDPPKDLEDYKDDKWIRGDTNGQKVVHEGLKNTELNR